MMEPGKVPKPRQAEYEKELRAGTSTQERPEGSCLLEMRRTDSSLRKEGEAE
jgi:hypothetical protein